MIPGSAEAGATLSQVSAAWGSIRSGIVHIFNDGAAETGTGLSLITERARTGRESGSAAVNRRHRGPGLESKPVPLQARPGWDRAVQYGTVQYSLQSTVQTGPQTSVQKLRRGDHVSCMPMRDSVGTKAPFVIRPSANAGERGKRKDLWKQTSHKPIGNGVAMAR